MRAVEMHNPLNDVCDRPPVETAGPGEKEAAHSRQGARPAKLVSSGIPVQTISHCRHPISAQIAHPINRRPADPIGGEAFDRWRGRELKLRGGELELRGPAGAVSPAQRSLKRTPSRTCWRTPSEVIR